MLYEWDENKAKANEAKHGVSFDMAYEFDVAVELEALDDTQGEERWVSISFIGLTLYTMVYVEADPERRRLISLRRSTRKEQEAYAKAQA